MEGGKICNIALQLEEMATIYPQKRAVVFPHSRDKKGHVSYTHMTFSELSKLSSEYAAGFDSYGITRGTKTLVMLRPSLDFFAVVFALFKVGAVPVLIDPGMGVERLLHCIESVRPEAMIGIELAHLMRTIKRKYFKSIKYAVTEGRRWLWSGKTLDEMRFVGSSFDVVSTKEDELAAILFTTGSTGPAKGVEYEHGMFVEQCRIIRDTYEIGAEDIDLPTFPLFALFSVGLGMTAVVPDMDPTAPAKVDPKKIIEAINKQGCTFTFGSPALWGRVSKYCVENDIKLPSLRKVLMAGAPVPPETHERLLRHILPAGAETHTPYGATESLPACDMRGSEVLAETASATISGKGFCVGRPADGVEVRIISLTDEVISTWDDSLLLPQGQVGEITVKGRNVTKRYYERPEMTALAKIKDGDSVVHRIGDLGYQDSKGRIWFCGRKAHRVETASGTLYTVCCEAIFNQHKLVARSALVGVGGVGDKTPVIVIEPTSQLDDLGKRKLANELLKLASSDENTAKVEQVLFYSDFPVDIRHNAKINREKLTAWAEAEIKKLSFDVLNSENKTGTPSCSL